MTMTYDTIDILLRQQLEILLNFDSDDYIGAYIHDELEDDWRETSGSMTYQLCEFPDRDPDYDEFPFKISVHHMSENLTVALMNNDHEILTVAEVVLEGEKVTLGETDTFGFDTNLVYSDDDERSSMVMRLMTMNKIRHDA